MSKLVNNQNRRKSNTYFKNHWQLYMLLIIPLLYIIIFKYVPMGGLLMAFQKYRISKGILGSEFVGFANFERFFSSVYFARTVRNTVALSFLSIVMGLPLPIILAICINEVKNNIYKKSIQMITYAPYFISTVVMVAMLFQWFELRTGMINSIIRLLGGEGSEFMGKLKYFRPIYVLSGLWQHTGFNSIIYLAALNSINPQLHEAAIVDGSTRLQRVWYIDIPGIMPTFVILLILSCGRILNVGFEKVYLMQNSLNSEYSTIISTYIYEIGLRNQDISYGTAVGLFNSVINLAVIVIVNSISKRVSETSLW